MVPIELRPAVAEYINNIKRNGFIYSEFPDPYAPGSTVIQIDKSYAKARCHLEPWYYYNDAILICKIKECINLVQEELNV